jgi:hypothetical protein
LKEEGKVLGGPGLLLGLAADLKGVGGVAVGIGGEDRKEFKDVLALGAKQEEGDEPVAKRLKPDPEAAVAAGGAFGGMVVGDVAASGGGAGAAAGGDEEGIVWEDVDLIGVEHTEDHHAEEGGGGEVEGGTVGAGAEQDGGGVGIGGVAAATAGEVAPDFDEEEWEDV